VTPERGASSKSYPGFYSYRDVPRTTSSSSSQNPSAAPQILLTHIHKFRPPLIQNHLQTSSPHIPSFKNQQQPPLISSQTTTKSNPSHIFTTPSTNNTPKLTLHPPSNHHEPLSTINTPKLKLSNNPLLKKKPKISSSPHPKPFTRNFHHSTHYHLNSP
jgi:hypothetical protein